MAMTHVILLYELLSVICFVLSYLFFSGLDTTFSEYLQARTGTDVIGQKYFYSSECNCGLGTRIYGFSEFQ